MTDPAHIRAQQIADAQQNYEDANTALDRAWAGRQSAWAEYWRAREGDPAAQSTDEARNAYRDALVAWVDATVTVEQARDELTAVSREV